MNAAAYERLWIESFSRRTAQAILCLLLVFYLLVALLYTLNGQFDWIHSRFYWKYFLWSIPFHLVLFARLRPVANPEAVKTTSHHSLFSLASWVLANICFVCLYFGAFASSFLQPYTAIFGDDDLIREEPLRLVSFSIYLAIFGYLKMVWRHRNVIIFHLPEENVGFFDLAWDRFKLSFRRSLHIIGFSFALLFLENICPFTRRPLTYSVYSIFYGCLGHHCAFVEHSFLSFLANWRLFYHLCWCGVSLVLLHTFIEIVVEYLFGRCFKLLYSSPSIKANPTPVLLTGLQSSKSAVRSQAILELRWLIADEPLWRESIFRDFVKDQSISRIICAHLIRIIKEYEANVALLNTDLTTFSKHFTELREKSSAPSLFSSGPPNKTITSSSSSLPAISDSIFSPRKKTLIERLLDRTMSSSQPTATKTSAPQMPDILEVKSLQPKVPVSSSTKAAEAQYSNGYIRLTAFIFSHFANTYPGRIYAGLACEMIKSWWLQDERVLSWTLDALVSLVLASYEEDKHGQIQFIMEDILSSIGQLYSTLTKFQELPKIGQKRMQDELFGTTSSPSECRAAHATSLLVYAVEAIVEKFSDSLGQLKISSPTRALIKNIGIAI